MVSKMELERGTDVLLLETGDALLLETLFTYGADSVVSKVKLDQAQKSSISLDRWRW